MPRKKIALIGAGQIGGTMAMVLAQRQLGDVVLIDVAEGLPQGKALDIMEGRLVLGTSCVVEGSNSLAAMECADVVIVTAGLPRKPGMSRDDLLEVNFNVMESVGRAIAEYAPRAFVIVVTNPLDAMVYALQKVSGLPYHRVVGMAGVLDSARLACFVAAELGVSPESVQATVMGGHGDTMVGVYDFCAVGGLPLREFMDRETFSRLVRRTAGAGGEIVNLLKSGSAFFSPAVCAIEMAETYLMDKKKVLTVAAALQGEFGVHGGLYCGVPVVLGAGGVERIVEVHLGQDEKKAFGVSVHAVRELATWVDRRMQA